MSVRLHLRPLPMSAKSSPATGIAPADAMVSGRLITVGLALYLLPALAIVAVVGGLGMLVLAAARLVAEIGNGRAPDPAGPVGPEANRS